MTGPKLAHVVAVRIQDHWSASFIESPEVAFSAESALEAVSRLLDGFDLVAG